MTTVPVSVQTGSVAVDASSAAADIMAPLMSASSFTAPAVSSSAPLSQTLQAATSDSAEWKPVTVLETDASGPHLFANQLQSGVWSASIQIETSGRNHEESVAAMDANGDVQVLWSQQTAAGAMPAPAPVPTTTVQPTSLAPTLPAGVRFDDTATVGANAASAVTPGSAADVDGYLSKSLSYSTEAVAAPGATTSSVTGTTYTVKAADLAASNPWAAITQTLFGAEAALDATAVASLRATVGNPVLSAGTMITPPQSLSYINVTNTTAALNANTLTSVSQTTAVAYTLNTASTSLSTAATQAKTESLRDSGLSISNAGWSAAQLLENNTDNHAAAEKVQFDSNGNGLAVWTEAYKVMARQYIKATDTWTAPIALNDSLTSGGIPPEEVHSASSANGNMLVTWKQPSVEAGSVIGKVYARRLVGGVWDSNASDIPVLSAPGIRSSLPVGAINDAGKAVVVFRHYDQGLGKSLSASAFNGSSWTHTSRIDDAGGAWNNGSIANDSQPSVAIDALGNARVMWSQYQPDPEGLGLAPAVYVSQYNANGTGSWVAPTLGFAPHDYYNIVPKTSFDAQGNGLAVWSLLSFP